MLQLLVLLLLVPVSSCDAPSLSSHDTDLASHDQPVSEEEYNAMKLLWEQKHEEVVEHQEVKRSKIKPSYITDLDVNNHHLDMLDLSYHNHHVSHEQTEHHQTSHEKSTLEASQVNTVERSRRQQIPDGHIGMGSGSGSGIVMRCDDPPAPSNGDFDNNGSIVTYMCEEGFVLVGNRQRFCDFTTWTWNGSDPTCEGPCTQDEPYVGSCDIEASQYYYHMSQDRCLPFDGCPAVEDGHNSYDSLLNCRDSCMASCNDSEGMMRFHRSVWTTNDCQLCTCINGNVTCDPMNLTECPTLFCGEDDPITLVEGCCPVCPTESCNTTDAIRLHNDTWTTDECQQCLCTNGRVTCSPPNTPSPSCDPADNCSDGVIVTNINTMCCPVCRPNITEGACDTDNITYYDGEIFMKDLCTMCQCNNGTINCTIETCPQCDEGTIAVNVPNQCCPECQELTSCELMENEPERITMFGICHSIHPVVKHYCPEQCRDDNDVVTRCCITTYFSNSTQFECEDAPGFPTEFKFLDANDCTCEPCG